MNEIVSLGAYIFIRRFKSRNGTVCELEMCRNEQKVLIGK